MIQIPIFNFNKNHPLVKKLEKLTLEYDWERIEKEIEPKFKEEARNKHRKSRERKICESEENEEKRYTDLFPEEEEKREKKSKKINNKRGAGRKGQPFIAYLKAFLFAPFLHIDQNHETIALHLDMNDYYRVMCGFSYPPSRRTLADFDEIMTDSGLWEKVRESAYRINVDKGIIKEEEEDTLNIDPTHIVARSTPYQYVKECRECPYFETCNHKLKTDETAGWYQKSKWSGYHSHMIGMCQLGRSGAPLERVILEGKKYEPSTISPLLKKVKEKHPEIDVGNVNVDGNFNRESVKEEVKKIYPSVHIYSPVNPGAKKDEEDVARGIKRVDPHGKVYCMAGREMKYRGKDVKKKAFMYVCPLYPNVGDCDYKEKCSPNSKKGRFVRIPNCKLSKVDWEVPQPSFLFRLIYNLRSKIERLFSRMKDRFKFSTIYQRGKKKVEAHIDKFMIVMHILAFSNGSYGV